VIVVLGILFLVPFACLLATILFHGGRTAWAFAIAPGATTALVALVAELCDRDGTGPLVLFFGLFAAYVPTLLFGLPAYIVLRNRIKLTLIACSAVGAAVAGLPWVLAFTGFAVLQRSIGFIPIQSALTVFVALFGGIGGVIFWLIAAPHSGTEQVKSPDHPDDEMVAR
jgi:hypothetical protein